MHVGFLLSPLLVLSRNIAQEPSRRLKYPEKREFQRRALASGFYVGVLLIVDAVIGTWTQWCLEGRNPWLWAILWLAEGRSPWSRPGLIAYWS
jgi:dolichol kinase